MSPRRAPTLTRPRRAFPAIIVIAAAIAVAAIGGAAAHYMNRRQAAARFPFPCLGTEGTALHVHPLLRIVIDDHTIPIPAAIGIARPAFVRGIAASGACFEPIHTHDASGIIHIESPAATRYTLGEFFAVWQATYPTITIHGRAYPVEYTDTSVFGHQADARHFLRLMVDGHASQAGPRLDLTTLDYCDRLIGRIPPCWPTAPGDPRPLVWAARYGSQHTVVIEYGQRGPIPAGAEPQRAPAARK